MNSRGHHFMTEADITYAVKAYAEGKSIRAIAAHIGCSYTSAHRWLKLSGVKLRKRGGAYWRAR